MTQTAKVYGSSLYELAKDENLTAEIMPELDAVAKIFRENPKYLELLVLPSVPKEERCGALDESLRGQVHQYLLNFLKILVENGTIGEYFGCVEAFRESYYRDNGICAVTCVSAVPLSDELSDKLRLKLEKMTGKTIVLTMKVDPDVLGGIKLYMNGNSYDGTVASRLSEVQKILFDTVL